jgi:hypothetical protein
MKTPYIFLALGAGIMASCQQQGQQESSTVADSTQTIVPAPTTNCYTKVVGRDTVQLTLSYQDSVATGTLLYNFFEKDKNRGEIKGLINKGIIRGKYVFYSEGMESTRPVIFKIDGQHAYEALPDSIDSQGLPVFDTDNARLKFDSIPMIAGKCE